MKRLFIAALLALASNLACAQSLPNPNLQGFKINGQQQMLPPSGVYVGTSDAQTLTNKSIDGSEVNSGIVNAARLPSPFTNGSASGNSSVFGTTSGTLTNGHCASFDASGNLIDAGNACNPQVVIPAPTGGDDTAEIQAAITAAIADQAKLICAGGTYTISSTISISGALWWNGSGCLIQPSSTQSHAFDIDTKDAVFISNLAVNYPVLPSSNDTFYVTDTASDGVLENQNSRFNNISITGAYIGFNFARASQWVIDGLTSNQLYQSNSGAIGVAVANAHLTDSGDSVITNSTLLGYIGAGGYGVKWTSSGGLRTTNTKFNGTDYAFSASLATGLATGDIFFEGNSIENTKDGFSLALSGSASFIHANVIGNEIWSTVQPVSVDGGAGTLEDVVINSNNVYGPHTSAGLISVAHTTSFAISGNSIKSDTTGGTGIAIGSPSSGSIGTNTYGSGITYQIANASPNTGGVGRTLLRHYYASNSASIADTTSMTTAYPQYELDCSNLQPATNAVSMELQVYENGTLATTGYANGAGSATTYVDLYPGSTVTNTSLYGWTGQIHFNNVNGVTAARYLNGVGVAATSSGPAISGIPFYGFHNASAVITGFKLQASSGNLSAGYCEMYGIQ